MKLIIDIPEEVYNVCKQYEADKCATWSECVIANGTPYDEVIDEVTELLENEWGYEGMREEVAKIMRGDI